ncbi:MAG: tRNA (adenosine(37)-N6)-threonylcarbamoyltransferase complex dimerization subunit type 1 TsaB [Paracoccaceae bacterium]
MVLAFDTSAAHCAAALLWGQTLLDERREAMAKGQAERLMPLLQDMLTDAGRTWGDLAAIGVGIGPGNFTGIRISVAAARGLALALGIPAVGVSTLEAQAHGVAGGVISTLDARRGAIYFQAFGLGEPSGAMLTAPDRLPALPAGASPSCIGDGAAGMAQHYRGRATLPREPLAVAIARIAAVRWQDAPTRPVPLYLRSADATPPADPAPTILP